MLKRMLEDLDTAKVENGKTVFDSPCFPFKSNGTAYVLQ